MSESRTENQPQRSQAEWREVWHEPKVYDDEDPDARCRLCGVRADRAVHSRSSAIANGREYIELDE